ncbi:MAG: hypothetical protein C3F06_04405 [Candidatus Methanoperedenaceae archaeon]|nr:MAG: hypothetical protein C3F06_04405 [Candidatus Methanoperedenaceae archaeon]
MSRLIYQRITATFIFILLLLLGAVLFLISIDLIGLAFTKLGFPPVYSVFLLFLSLIGSYINIPIKEITSKDPVISSRTVNFYWFRYIIPPLEVEHRTLIAVNLGGGVIPVLISAFLIPMVKPLDILTGVAIMTVFIHMIARPVKGLGIAVPALLPPIAAAILALMISPENAPIIAYISGTLGSLIGADLLNLKKIPGLGAQVASIGGAGTFDGIFLTGIISVLLA